VCVLHIEDDPLQSYKVALHLANIAGLDCTAKTAVSEATALALFEAEPFDVVLLDYHLSEGNGLGCLRRLRRLDAVVPIIVVSGLAAPTIAADLLDAGADDFLSKDNLSGESLSRSLKAALARADAVRRRGELGSAPAVRRPEAVEDDEELMRSLRELRERAATVCVSAAKVQRLVEVIGAELEGALPRRALFTLFLRLFGGENLEKSG
jgi:DNA-binding response OmpR family regulator